MKTVVQCCSALLVVYAASLQADMPPAAAAPTAGIAAAESAPAAAQQFAGQLAMAAVPASAATSTPTDFDSPAAMLQQGMDKLLDYLKAHPHNQGLGEFLATEISSSFDFPYMAQAAAGAYGRHMSAAQLRRLAKKLQVMFLTAMADKLRSYDGQDVVYLPERFGDFDRTTITALVNNPGGYPGRIDFRIHLTEDGWKIFDVAASGQSAIAYYRNYFRRAMRRQG
jgi:phospholipid transport system substrate-binding protein